MTTRYFTDDQHHSEHVNRNLDFQHNRHKWRKTENRFEPNKQFRNDGISKARIKRYERGGNVNTFEATSVKRFRKTLQKDDKKSRFAARMSARTELLLPEESGYLEADENESTYQISQKEIASAVDITSATKHFALNLEQFGPYCVNYYRNGRQLLMGGKRGHVAAIDWLTKDLLCEFNVQESVHDVQWLHMPTMFAVAQKDWVHIYDNTGIELHCLKKLYRVCKLDFLAYHFLLVSASDNGYLSWLDVSMGKVVNNFKMRGCPRITTMKQNPYNAIIATSHPNGTVNMWSPNEDKYLVSMLCHGSSIRDIAFDDSGRYMATAGVDRNLKIWDIRNYKCLQDYKLRAIPGHIDISQRDIIAVSIGNVVEMYKNCFRQTTDAPYLRHRLNDNVFSLEFCNYEDVLGIGHENGFTSILVPGSGEPNFDAYETNPYMTKSQRREMEVKSLLEKIQPQLISLDSQALGKVNVTHIKQQIEEKKNVRHVKPKRIEFESRAKRRMKSARKVKVKRGLQQQFKRNQIKELVRHKLNANETNAVHDKSHVLDRFKPRD